MSWPIRAWEAIRVRVISIGLRLVELPSSGRSDPALPIGLTGRQHPQLGGVTNR